MVAYSELDPHINGHAAFVQFCATTGQYSETMRGPDQNPNRQIDVQALPSAFMAAEVYSFFWHDSDV
jgi:hypothetical protein